MATTRGAAEEINGLGAGRIQDANDVGWTDGDAIADAVSAGWVWSIPEPGEDLVTYTSRVLPYSERLFKIQTAAILAWVTRPPEQMASWVVRHYLEHGSEYAEILVPLGWEPFETAVLLRKKGAQQTK